jgi:hypothetical protein
VVDINQINLENEISQEGEILPAYDTSMMDVVLDIGPAVQRAPGNTSEYISRPLTTTDSGVLAHPSPPEYDRDSSIELATITPPPDYLPTHTRNN